MRRLTAFGMTLLLCLACVACERKPSETSGLTNGESAPPSQGAFPSENEVPREEHPEETAAPDGRREVGGQMRLMIGETSVRVEWENNSSVEALRELASSGGLSIQMSMHGGFEQVGPIGSSLPRDDVQTTAQPGDIMLYSGNQLVMFYGSNSWAYTRLGRITDQDPGQMRGLLGSGDVTVTITAG